MSSNILIGAWLYKDAEGRKIVATDKKLLVGSEEEDWEPISLVIPIAKIKEWCEAYREIEGEQEDEIELRDLEKYLELCNICNYVESEEKLEKIKNVLTKEYKTESEMYGNIVYQIRKIVGVIE